MPEPDLAKSVLARHVRRTADSMEPDPEHPGQMRQSQWCACCGQKYDLDPRWPCPEYRAALALDAATERVARLEAALRQIAAKTLIRSTGAGPLRLQLDRIQDAALAVFDPKANAVDLAAAREALAE